MSDQLDPGRLRLAADALKPSFDDESGWSDDEREDIARPAIEAYHGSGDCPTCKRAVDPVAPADRPREVRERGDVRLELGGFGIRILHAASDVAELDVVTAYMLLAPMEADPAFFIEAIRDLTDVARERLAAA